MPRSRGARIAVALAVSLTAGALAAETGDEAFRRRDYATAAELWRAEAEAGSAGAAFGLGLLADLGLGRGRDTATALRWYLEAAGLGLPVAQFNVGVMLDAGSGVAPDRAAAATWYARAAANGHPRARYNLGLLYEAGTGVPTNPDIARLWYEAAGSDIPAAAERTAGLAPVADEDRRSVAPSQVTGDLVETAGGLRAELVWTAPPGPVGRPFAVELAPEPGAAATLSAETGVSALSIRLPEAANWVWRVGRAGDGATPTLWSDWRPIVAPSGAQEPGKQLVILFAADDDVARSYAQELSERFVAGGLGVTLREAPGKLEQSGVAYAHVADATLASAVAQSLPGLGAGGARPDPDLDLAPGEIALRLVGGPAPQGGDR